MSTYLILFAVGAGLFSISTKILVSRLIYRSKIRARLRRIMEVG